MATTEAGGQDRGRDPLPQAAPVPGSNLYRAIVAEAPEAVVIVNAGGSVVGFNHAAGDLLGRCRAEPLGAQLYEMLTPLQDGDGLPHSLGELYRHATTNGGAEHILSTSDGEELHVAATARSLDGDGGGWSVVHLRDLSLLHAAETELVRHALHDHLTGLPGRELFMNRLTHALAGRRAQSGSVGVLFFDLDAFKQINDTFGHAAGDTVLREVAARAGKVIRPEDTLARMAGDEFTVLLERLPAADEAYRVADRIQEGAERPVPFERSDLHPRVSIGVAVVESHEESPEMLLRRADAAMYASKEKRRQAARSAASDSRV